MEPNCTSRNASTVAPQSLMLMNSDFVTTRSAEFARRVQREAGDDIAWQIRLAWQLAFAAEPSDHEVEESVRFVNAQTEHFAANPLPESKDQPKVSPQHEAFTSFCHALLSSNRFLYID
jgi:hypothetical protein